MLRLKEDIIKVLLRNLQKAQHHMKVMANKNKIDQWYKLGDMVYVKLYSYKQVTMDHRNQKLYPKYFEPFVVIEVIGPMAYRLQLPPKSLIHNVLHVSHLQPSFAQVRASPTLPTQL